MNTVAGLKDVPEFMLVTAAGCGMTTSQVWRKIRFPLAMPLIFAGIIWIWSEKIKARTEELLSLVVLTTF